MRVLVKREVEWPLLHRARRSTYCSRTSDRADLDELADMVDAGHVPGALGRHASCAPDAPATASRASTPCRGGDTRSARP